MDVSVDKNSNEAFVFTGGLAAVIGAIGMFISGYAANDNREGLKTIL